MNLLDQIRVTQLLLQYLDHLADYADHTTPSDKVSPGAAARCALAEGKAMYQAMIAERDKPEEFRWTRLKSSMNGNPRHKTLLDYFCTREELQIMAHSINRKAYDQAVKDATDRVKALGGRMTASGPVVSSYNRSDFVRRVGDIVGRKYISVE